MKTVWKRFLRDHFERHMFIYQALALMTGLYILIPASREQIMPMYFLIIGLFINKARSTDKEPDPDQEQPRD